jgi:hypothetical protein
VKTGGKTVAGVVVGETTDSISLKLPDGSTKAVAKDQFLSTYGIQ